MNRKERLQEVINQLNISQAELARKAGVGKGLISNYLNPNDNKQPGGQFALKLEKTLGVSSDWLLEGEGEIFTEEAGTSLPAAGEDTSQEEKELIELFKKTIRGDKEALLKVEGFLGGIKYKKKD